MDLADVATRPAGSTATFTGPAATQEACMFDTFAAAAAALGGDDGDDGGAAFGALRHAPRFWAAVSLQTQAVLEAIVQSEAQGGKAVPVPAVP